MLENLRAELSGAGVDGAKLDKQMLQQMLGRVSGEECFQVSIADIKVGRARCVAKNLLVKTFGRMTNEPTEDATARSALSGRSSRRW
jgi:hypothetical protein